MNMKSQPIIAIFAGGYSGEHNVSIRSAKGIYSWIDRALFRPFIYVIEPEQWYILHEDGTRQVITKGDVNFDYQGESIRPDYAYITIHGTPGEDGILQGHLDTLGIPYNTGGVLTEALTFNKFACNRYLASFPGIRTAKSVRLVGGESDAQIMQLVESLGGYPIFIKPNTGGSSVATSRIERAEDVLPAVYTAFAESSEVMLEALIRGVEVTCGAYMYDGIPTILEITEVVSKNSFFDFDAKYNGSVDEITPARIPNEQAELIREQTLAIYDYVQAKGIIRIDYIIEADGYPTLLEVNTTPGMTPTSFIPQQVAAAGLSMSEVLSHIINSSIK